MATRITLKSSWSKTSFDAFCKGQRIGIVKHDDSKWLACCAADDYTIAENWESFDSMTAVRQWFAGLWEKARV